MKKLTLYYDKENGELFFQGVSSRINTRDASPVIQKEYEKIVGPTARMIIYNAVKRSNRALFGYIYKSMLEGEGRLSKRKAVIKILKLLPKMGYGVPELTHWNINEGTFKVRVKNCYNTIAYKDSDRPVCYYMSSKLAAIFEVVFGKKVDCREKACLAMSQYDCCEFEVRVSNEDIETIERPYRIQEESDKYDEVDLLFDEKKGEVVFEGSSSEIIPREEQPAIKREFEGIIGTTAGTIIHGIARYQAAKAVSSAQRIIIKVMGRLSKRRTTLELLKQLPRRGYGVPELTYFDEKERSAMIRVKNSMDAVGYRHSDKPVCSGMSGILAGGAIIVFNRKMECIETKCVAIGDPYCEFEVFEKRRVKELQDVLRGFSIIGDVEGSLIMARDGTLLASDLPEEVDAEMLAMMASTVMGATNRGMSELGGKSVETVTIETDKAKIIIRRAGENASLIAVTKPDIMLGLILTEMEKTSEEIGRSVG